MIRINTSRMMYCSKYVMVCVIVLSWEEDDFINGNSNKTMSVCYY